MPGIFGYLTQGNFDADHLACMADISQSHDWHKVECLVEPIKGYALGRTSLDYTNRSPQPVQIDDYIMVMDGELYPNATISSETMEEVGQAQALLQAIASDGPDVLTRVEGSFSGAVIDQAKGSINLFNDRFGQRPLYYCEVENGLVFASDLLALLSYPGISTAPSHKGLADFFFFGHYFGCDTSFEQVRVLDAATWCEFAREESNQLKYWNTASECEDLPSTRQEWLEAVDDSFAEAVARRTASENSYGIALSGGLDARTMLGVVDNAIRPHAICYTMPGSLDHTASRKMAQAMQLPYDHITLAGSFLDSFENHMQTLIDLTAGQYLSQAIPIPTFPFYREKGIEVLLRGHAGELMHMRKAYAYSIDDSALSLSTDDGVENWLFTHLQGYMLDAVDGEILKQQSDLRDLARSSITNSLSGLDSVPHTKRIWHVFVRERLRRETTLSLAKFGSVVQPRTPYLDNRLIELLMNIPAELAINDDLQRHILQKRRPEFLDIVNANTGAKIGAGKWTNRFYSLRNRVFAKLGFPGFQPYERLGLWLRRELAPYVQRILLSEETLDRGLFDPSTLRSVVNQHMANTRNHTFLIMAMMIYELGQRRIQSATRDLATSNNA